MVMAAVVMLNSSPRNRFWPEAMSCVVPPPVSHCCVSKVRTRADFRAIFFFLPGYLVFLCIFHFGQKVLNNSDFADDV